MQQSDLICVKKVPGKGRGVFAKRAIKKGAILERVPVVLVPLKDLVDGKKNPFLNVYLYQWSKTHFAVCLGYGLLYNHSFEPNATFKYGRESMTYLALRDIAAGEEILINYHMDLSNKTPMDFDVM